MRLFDKLKADFEMRGGLVASKLNAKVEKCKEKSGVTKCKNCQDFKVCPIKKWERLK